MSKVDDLLAINGLSKTKARVQILNQFIKTNRPLSIFDFKKLKNFKNINESSIYRNLNRFTELGILQLVPSSNEAQSYELSHSDNHHHHITCNVCNEIKCLSACSIDKELKAMAKKVGFLLKGHSLELIGTCHKCQHQV